MDERYSIEVNDEAVVIYGQISIEEAFDFLSFFEKKGFKSISTDDSTLYMRKKSIEQVQEEKTEAEHKRSEAFYEGLYESKKKDCEKIALRVQELEQLVKKIISERSDRVRHLEEANQRLLKCVQLHKLMTDENIRDMIKDNCLGSQIMEIQHESTGTSERSSQGDDGNQSPNQQGSIQTV